MSEPKLISPLLDGFVIGGAISEHHGVRCYPAMREGTDEKYIVKIISVPASRVQLDAMLLSGAYRDQSAALAYFKDLAEGITQEAEVLKRLARLEGFCAYEGCQIVPMEDGTGYLVYLLGTYKRSLAKLLKRQGMTHLAAVNLGLDLCSALAVCRRAGCLYIDLKPDNIFVEGDQFRIGDLGLVSMSSLKYASLPDKYRSSYTAPEISDAFSSLNTTVDIYALGLVLYQIYNDNFLPFSDNAPAEPLAAPLYADYEMAEIILKACNPDPAQRWEDPAQMGQALVSYMQRNGVNDTPIIPLPTQKDPIDLSDIPVAEEPVAEVPPLEVEDTPEDEAAAAAPVVGDIADTDAPAEITIGDIPEDDTPAEPAPLEDIPGDDTPADDAPAEDAPADDTPAEDAPAEDAPAEDTPAEDAPAEDDPADLSFMDTLVSDETAPSEELAAALEGAVVSDEASAILAQADELIAHETPDPVVAPDPIDVPIPEPIQPEPAAEPEAPETGDTAQVAPETDTPAEDDVPEEAGPEPEDAEDDVEEEDGEPKKPSWKWLLILLVVALLAGIGYCGYYYYENYYLQDASIQQLQGSGTDLTVQVSSEADESLLSVSCTDTYGNAKRSPVENGLAHFTDLNPSTQYIINVEIEGFHSLTGSYTASYATDPQTNIVSFSAITGAEDGSVILSFTVDGKDPENGWVIRYQAEGEEERTFTANGHWVTITGLTVGKEYTFRLTTEDHLIIAGILELKHTASKVILAQDPVVGSYADGVITVNWAAPEGVEVEKWFLRCYSDAGYEATMEVTGNTATFENIDVSSAHTVEITAAGMTQSAYAYLTANPITIVSVLAEMTVSGDLVLQWGYDGADPEGWLLLYTVDGTTVPTVIKTEGNTATIETAIPGGCYQLEFQTADGTSIFNQFYVHQLPTPSPFSAYKIDMDDMEFHMIKTPEKENWTWRDIKDTMYTNAFASGDKASFLVALAHWNDASTTNINTLFVIRDANGVPIIVDQITRVWNDMWSYGYCEFNIPEIPTEAGTYTIEVYFNGALANTQQFTVS